MGGPSMHAAAAAAEPNRASRLSCAPSRPRATTLHSSYSLTSANASLSMASAACSCSGASGTAGTAPAAVTGSSRGAVGGRRAAAKQATPPLPAALRQHQWLGGPGIGNQQQGSKQLSPPLAGLLTVAGPWPRGVALHPPRDVHVQLAHDVANRRHIHLQRPVEVLRRQGGSKQAVGPGRRACLEQLSAWRIAHQLDHALQPAVPQSWRTGLQPTVHVDTAIDPARQQAPVSHLDHAGRSVHLAPQRPLLLLCQLRHLPHPVHARNQHQPGGGITGRGSWEGRRLWHVAGQGPPNTAKAVH